MSAKANVRSLLASYVSSKTGKTVTFVNLANGPQDQYPFALYTQECHRVLNVAVNAGENIVKILEAFVAGKPVATDECVGMDEYKGNGLLVFRMDATDKRALKFGAGKAKKMLAAFQAHGVKAVIGLLQEVIGDSKATEQPKPKKAGKPAGGGGKGGTDAMDDGDTQDVLGSVPVPSAGGLAEKEAELLGLMRRAFALQREIAALKGEAIARVA